MICKNERKIGAILAYILIGANTAVGIFFTPYLIYKLGQKEYGLYQLIGSFVGYLTILDFGLSAAITRYVAKYREIKDLRSEENFVAMCLIIYVFIALIVIFTGWVGYRYLDIIFGMSLSIDELHKGRLMTILLTSSMVVNLFDRAFVGILAGYERFIYPRTNNLLRILLKVCAMLVLLLNGCGAVSIVIIDTLGILGLMIADMYYLISNIRLRIRFHHWDRQLISEIISFSFFIFLMAITDQLLFRLPQVIIGIVEGTASVAIFSIAMQLNQVYMYMASAITSVFMPKMTQLVTRGASREEITDMMISPSRFQFMVLGGVLCLFILFGKQFIELWVGAAYYQAYTITLIVMVSISIQLFQNLMVVLVQAQNRHAFRSVCYLFTALLGSVASFYMVKRYGPIGAAVGTGSSIVLGSVFIMNFYYHYVAGINIPHLYIASGRGTLLVILMAGILGLLIIKIPGKTWLLFFLKANLFLLVYIFLLWFIAMRANEKALIKSIIGFIGKNGDQ